MKMAPLVEDHGLSNSKILLTISVYIAILTCLGMDLYKERSIRAAQAQLTAQAQTSQLSLKD